MMTQTRSGVKTYNINIKLKADKKPTEKVIYEAIKKHLNLNKNSISSLELRSEWVTVEEVKNALVEQLTW